MLSKRKMAAFKNFIWDFYTTYGREFAWRKIDDPYRVLVSEIMLQQTQTFRVTPKYEQFIATFPTFNSLACASLRDVLGVWQGLGYNRRGMYVHNIAQKVMSEFNGQLPCCPNRLQTLPGIGKNTAASICAFAFNMPTVFIETNIRAVFIHCFFPNKKQIHDNDILPLVAQTVDHKNPREWYYALMDYGVWLKKQCANPARKSAHHNKQSRFEGSDRQIRGMIIKKLTEQACMTKDELMHMLQKERTRVDVILKQLRQEGLLSQAGNQFSII